MDAEASQEFRGEGEVELSTLQEFLVPLKNPLALFGLVGQLLFFSRFFVQWIASEKKGKSHIPVVFWYLSLGGGAMLLTYALWRRDAIIALGQAVGILVYVRNLMLIAKEGRNKGKGQPEA